MSKPVIYLVCNAHLDPVWLWEWEEGAAEAVSTFRTAADLCEEFPEFVFCHNEALLYQWVEEYEPALFARIRRLVQRKQWHIMGGWFLQPDCNMPSGESFVRQILAGRRYFREKFGVVPTTAINFDPFGHSRGLAQILARSGYDSYMFCRPGQAECPLPGYEFEWVGYDGSSVMGSRCLDWYNSALGKARTKIETRLKDFPARGFCYLLWGVGNHGGGPSRKDLADIRALREQTLSTRILHSTPEAYFAALAPQRGQLPRFARDLNSWGPGCYTAQVRIKQAHRRLENELYSAEKMSACAALQGLMPRPDAELRDAQRDLLFGEFHDILPGSSIQPVEEAALRLMGHGLEILSRVKARSFFALAQGQPRAAEGRIPVLVFNPHPYPVRTLVECEFQPADQNWANTFTDFTAHAGRRALPSQIEKEASNLPLDWRKRIVFEADLKPMQMNRFDCRPTLRPARPAPTLRPRKGRIEFDNGTLSAVINTRTGWMDSLKIRGVEHLGGAAFRPMVIEDSPDPWGVAVQSYRTLAGVFKLATQQEAARLSGLDPDSKLAPVRIIEDGAVRVVVEALYRYGDSWLVQQFKLPRRGAEIEVALRVHWNEKDRFLKLSLPVREALRCVGQTAFGAGELDDTGKECVAQKWVAVGCRGGRMLTVINEGSYGLDFADGELRLSLVRSPAYSAHPLENREPLVRDRCIPRMDQGERQFRFWIQAGPDRQRLAAVDREALAHNEQPMALSFFPGGQPARKPEPLALLTDSVVQMPAIKTAEDGRGILVRLFNPTAERRRTTLVLPVWGVRRSLTFGPYEVQSLRFDPRTRKWQTVDLMES